MDDLLAMMPFAATLGLTLEEASAERVIARLPWREEHCTAGGVLHGGALISLADSAGALCAFLGLPEGASTATTSSHTNLLRAVRDGTVTATAIPVHRGRTLVVVRTDLTDRQGRLVAETIQSQAVLPGAQ
jgi:uncharacterized protein (TIGR00369 family)